MQGQRSMDHNRNVEEVEVVEEGRREEGQGEGGGGRAAHQPQG